MSVNLASATFFNVLEIGRVYNQTICYAVFCSNLLSSSSSYERIVLMFIFAKIADTVDSGIP